MVRRANAAGGRALAKGRGDVPRTARPDVITARRGGGWRLLAVLDLLLDAVGGGLLGRGHLLHLGGVGGELLIELVGLGALLGELRLPRLKLGLLALEVVLIGLDLRAQILQRRDDALVVLGDLVDKVDPAQQIRKARRLEQHRPVRERAALLLAAHLLAEELVLRLFLLLVLGQLALERGNLGAGVVDLRLQQIILLVEDVLLGEGVGLAALQLGELLF